MEKIRVTAENVEAVVRLRPEILADLLERQTLLGTEGVAVKVVRALLSVGQKEGVVQVYCRVSENDLLAIIDECLLAEQGYFSEFMRDMIVTRITGACLVLKHLRDKHQIDGTADVVIRLVFLANDARKESKDKEDRQNEKKHEQEKSLKDIFEEARDISATFPNEAGWIYKLFARFDKEIADQLVNFQV